MPRRDRLLALSTCHLALRSTGLASPEAVLAASPELRHQYRHVFGEILKLIERRHPDAMRVLFWPKLENGVAWQAAILGEGESPARLLFVDRGPIVGAREDLLRVVFRADDGHSERDAWRALVDVLRAAWRARALAK